MTFPEVDGVTDFTIPHDLIRFRIDDDLFEVPGVIPVNTLRKLVAAAQSIQDHSGDMDVVFTAVGDTFQILLGGEAGQRFNARLLTDDASVTPPIDLQRQALPILFWLLERYGIRPTQPSSASSDGSTDGNTPNGGTSSTDGASPAETATT